VARQQPVRQANQPAKQTWPQEYAPPAPGSHDGVALGSVALQTAQEVPQASGVCRTQPVLQTCSDGSTQGVPPGVTGGTPAAS
jgi:hypothetical protein